MAKNETLRLKFTKAALASLPVPERGRVYHYDTEVKGLAVCVTKTETKTFYVYRKLNGKPVRYRLGTFPELSIEKARKAAAEKGAAIGLGKDPNEEKRARRQEPTLGDLWEKWAETKGKRCRTWVELERNYKRYWEKWATRRLSEVKKMTVAARHTEIGKEHPYAANRAVELLRLLYNAAERLVGWSGTNPAQGIERFTENKRERFLTPAEVQALVAAIDQEETFWRTYWTCALWTGQRESSITRMRWQDVYLGQALWVIPAEFSKNGRQIAVALMPPVVEVLSALRAVAPPNSPWVFFSKASDTGHITEVKGTWKRLKTRSGIADPQVIPYTLRHTVASQLGISGTSQSLIAAALGHANIRTSERYTHLNIDPVRVAMNGVTQRLLTVQAVPANHKQETQDNGQAETH